MPEQFTDGNIGAHGSPISPADRDITDASLSNLSAVGQQGAIDSGAYSSNHPSGMVGATPQDEIRYRQEHEPYNYQPDGDQFVYITKAYLYEIHPLTTELIKKHELSPLKIKLDTKKGCVYSQFMTDQQGKLLDDYILLKTEEDDPPESTPFELLDGDGTEDTEKYGIYNVLLFKFANGVILRNNYDSDKDDPRSVRDHGGIEGHRGPLIWSCGYNTLHNAGLGQGLIYRDYTKSDDKKNLRSLLEASYSNQSTPFENNSQVKIATSGDHITIRGNSNDKNWKAFAIESNSGIEDYNNPAASGTTANEKTLATFQDGLLIGTPSNLEVVEVAKATGSGTTVNTFVNTSDVTLNVDTLTSTSVNLPTGSGIELSTEKYTPTLVSTEGPITRKTDALVKGTDINLDSVEVTSVEMLPPSGSSLQLETYDYKPTSVSTEGPLTKKTASLSGGSDIDLQAVKLQTQAITPPSGSSLDLETKQYATVDLGIKETGIDGSVLKGGAELTTTATQLRSKNVPVQDTGVKEYTSKAFPPHTLTAKAGTLQEVVGAGNEVTLSSVELSPTSLSGITLNSKTYTPTQVGTTETTVTSSFTGGAPLTTTATEVGIAESPILEFDTKKYTSRKLEQLSLQKKTNILSKSTSTAETTLEATALKTTSITPPSGTTLSLGTKTYTPRLLSKQTFTKETTALKGGDDLNTTVATLSTKKADIVSSTPNTYKARSLSKTTLSPQLLALKGGSDLTCNPTDLNTETLEAPALPVKTFTTTELGTISLSKQSDALTGGTNYTCTPTTMTTKSFSRVEESFNENLQQQSGALEGGSDYTCTPTAMTTKSFTTQNQTWYGGSTLTLEWKQVSAYTDNSTIWVLSPTNTPSDTSSSLSAIVGAQQYTALKRASGNTGTDFHLYQSGTSAVTGNNKVLTTDSSSTAAVTLRKDIGTYTGVKNLSNANVYLYSTTGASDTRVYIKPPTTSPVEDNHYLYFSTDSVTASKVLTTDSTTETSVVIRNGATEYTGVTGISSSSGILFYTAASTGKQFLEADSADNNNDTTKVYCTDSGSTRNFLSHTGNPTKVTYHVYTDADSVSGQKVLKTDSDNTEEVLRTGITPFTATKGISSAVTLYEAPASSESSSDTFLETASASAADTFLYSTSDADPRRFLSKSGSDSDTAIQLYNAGTGNTVVETKVLELDSSASGGKTLRVGATEFDAVTGIPESENSVEFYKAHPTSENSSENSSDTFLETSESTDQHLYFSTGTTTHSVITSSGTSINVVHTVGNSATDALNSTKFVKIKAGDSWTGDEKSFMHTIDTYDGVTATVGNEGVNVYKAVDEDDNPSHNFLETTDSKGTESHIYATTSAANDTRFLTTGNSAANLYLYSTPNNNNETHFLKVPNTVEGQKTLRVGMSAFNAVTGIAANTILYSTASAEPSDARFLKTTYTDSTDATHNLYVSDDAVDKTFLTGSGSDIGILTSDSVSGVSAVNYVKANNDSLSSGKVFKHTIGTYTGLSSNDNQNVIVYEAPDSETRNFLETGENAETKHRVYSTNTSTTSTRFLSTSEDDSLLTSLNLYSTVSPDTTTKFLKVADSESGNKILKHGITNFNAVTNIPNGTKLYHAGSASNHHFLKSPTALSDHHVYFSGAASDSSNKMPFVTSSGSSINIVKSSDDSNTGAFSLTRFLKTTGDNVAALDSVSKTFKHSFGTYTGIDGDSLSTVNSNANEIYVYTTSAANSNSSEKFVKTTDTGDRHVFISADDTTRNFITSTGSAVNVLTAGSMSNSSTAKFVKTAATNVDALDSSKTFQHTFDTYTGMTGLSATSDLRLYSTVGADTTTKFVKTDANHTTTKFLYVSGANNPRTFITSTGSSNTNVLTSSSDVNVLTTDNVDPSSITLVKSVNTTPSTIQTISGSEYVLKAP